MFSLFSTCFFSVRVLEGSIGNRGRYGTTEEEEAALPSSSATSVRKTTGLIKSFTAQKGHTAQEDLENGAIKRTHGIAGYTLFFVWPFLFDITSVDSATSLHVTGVFSSLL